MSDLIRKISYRPLQPDLILIFTEGEKTEPNYFKCFKLNSVKHVVIGTGMNTKSLVKSISEQTKSHIKEYAIKNKLPIDEVDCQVWAVFDKDDFSDTNFDNAIYLAENKSYKVAWSNESFELWYYLHYHYHETGSIRDWYNRRLTEELGFKYRKNSTIMYALLMDRQKIAIKNSKKLYKKSEHEPRPSKRNPCTTVHELVNYLNKFLV